MNFDFKFINTCIACPDISFTILKVNSLIDLDFTTQNIYSNLSKYSENLDLLMNNVC